MWPRLEGRARVGFAMSWGAWARAISRVAQIAATAFWGLTALTLASLAADKAANGKGGDGRLVGGAGAGTMEQALIQAYQNNPQLNAQRAATRATDENVPGALAGYRPRISGTSSLTEQYLDTVVRAGSTPATGALYSQTKGAAAISSFGLTATQTLWNGFQTASRTRQAEG